MIITNIMSFLPKQEEIMLVTILSQNQFLITVSIFSSTIPFS